MTGAHAVRPALDQAEVLAASALFDDAPDPAATERFLTAPGHHLLIAYGDDGSVPVGFVTGIEMTHPDKGTEMFVYELGVAEPHRRRGVARSLLDALEQLARARVCYGMWVLTEADNQAARATYARLGEPDTTSVLYGWTT